MAARLQLIGQTFGRLTVIGNAPNYVSISGQRHAQWICRCECGTEKVIRSSDLRAGRTTSCGCWRSESTTARSHRHGQSTTARRTKAYMAWAGMLQRCTNPSDKEWHNYGGRGITVCDEWRRFEAFHADMGEPPEGRSLDRVDVDGPYNLSNCRWATAAEQARNKRGNVWIIHKGQRMVLEDAARMEGIGSETVNYRRKAGWPQDLWFVPPGRRGVHWSQRGLEN